MASNKFATMVHKNTNKITLILTYAILEWVLIILLLLNSLFSYLIIKFADYFGLKRPCLLCSRLDHIFEPTNFQDSYRSLVCETHAAEISKLGYCSNHRKLAESLDMCVDCSSSSSHMDFSKKFAFFPWMKQLGVLQDCSGGDKVSENGEVDLKCSCCGVGLDTKFYYHDYCLSKPSWEDLDHAQIGNFVLGSGFGEKVGEDDHSVKSGSDLLINFRQEEQRTDGNRGIEVGIEAEENDSCSAPNLDCKDMVDDDHKVEDIIMELEQKPVKKYGSNVSAEDESSDDKPVAAAAQVGCSEEDLPREIQFQHLEFYIDQNDCHLIPIELMESGAAEKDVLKSYEKGAERNSGNEDFVLEFDENVERQYELVVEKRRNLEEDVPLLLEDDREEESKIVMVESRETEKDDREEESKIVMVESRETEEDDREEESKIVMVESRETEEDESSFGVNQECDIVKEEPEQFAADETAQTPSIDGKCVQESLLADGEEMELVDNQALEEGLQMQSDENEPDVSIGTEIPDHELMDLQTHEVPLHPFVQDGLSTSYANYFDYDYNGSNEAEDNGVEFKTITIEKREAVIESHLSLYVESNEVAEDKIPDTPTSMDSFHHLHKKLLLERRESGTEDSLDGSVISDIEAGDGAFTMEKLKSALKSERKALNALYAELEEERSASAVAANQTMAMINRLQEEKAAMQMEALQYQRMMEEQSEYDQEALQLLNELMVKREKEKAELEKEMEVLRKKLQDYEEKMRMMMLKRMKDSSTRSGTCSASFSNSEDSDGMSVDLNNEAKDEDRFGNHLESSNQNTPVDAVIYLEESLMNFEEERLSILDQLKVLEDKLFTLSDGEEQHFEDIESIEHLHAENGNGHNDVFDCSSEGNGVINGHYKEMNGKHQSKERKIVGAKAKRLLPLFDATDAETEDGLLNGHEDEFDSVAAFKSVNDGGKKLTIEEEVDHVYERLHALEADREFLRHCMTSLSKGDKGLELLQEILQHLRDLRSVEQRVKNMGDDAL